MSEAEKELKKLFKSSAGVNLEGYNAQYRIENIEEQRQLNDDLSLLVEFEVPYAAGVNNVVTTLHALKRLHGIETTEQLLEVNVDQLAKVGSKTNSMLKAMQEVLKERANSHK